MKNASTIKETKGIKLNFGDGHTLVAGKPGHFAVEEGQEWHSGAVKFADGTEHNALLFVDRLSSGEHGGTIVILPDGNAEQGEPDFLKLLGRTKEQVFPYKYKFHGGPLDGDHHWDAQY